MKKLLLATVFFLAASVPTPADDASTCVLHGGSDNYAIVSACTRLIARNPNDARAYYVRGLIYAIRVPTNPQEAVVDLSRALEIGGIDKFEDVVSLYYSRMQANIQLNYFKSALADTDSLLATKPTSTFFKALRAKVLVLMNRNDEAIGALNQVISEKVSPFSIYWRGRAHLNKKGYGAAVRDLEMVIEQDTEMAFKDAPKFLTEARREEK